jgi:hypothetical protein
MPLSVPNIDDRSFEQIVAEARARIPVHTPEWTNFNESDPGITLVQLFAFMTENLLYRSNRVPELNRRKFLSLLGLPLRPAAPARGIVVFLNERGPARPWPLEPGAELRAGKTPFRTRTGVCVLPVSAAVFYKRPRADLDAATRAEYRLLYESFLDTDADQLQFYQATRLEEPALGRPLPVVDLGDTEQGTIDRAIWVALLGQKDRDLDETRRALGDQTLTLGIAPAPRCTNQAIPPDTWVSRPTADPGLVFEIAAPNPAAVDPQTGQVPAAYAPLPPQYADNVLEAPGIVQLRLPPADRLQVWDHDPEEEGTGAYPPLVEDKELAKRIVTWIRVRLRSPDQAAAGSGDEPVRQSARLSWVGANAARVVQALPVSNERLGTANGAPGQVYRVANTPVLSGPTAAATLEAPAEERFVLEIRPPGGVWERWRQIDDLFAARREEQVFVLDSEAGTVSFGDGLRGRRPPLGADVRASYEYGGGLDGMVAIGAINASPALPGGFKVSNPLATWGAAARETVAEGERNITRHLRHRDRAVTAADFRDLALRTPGVEIGRVEVLPLFNPMGFSPGAPAQEWPGFVTVLVIPRHDAEQPEAPRPDRLFLRAICEWLEPRRLITAELHVAGPLYVPLYVSVGIVTMPGFLREQVRADVEAALSTYLSALRGGQPVEPGAAPGEDCLDELGLADPCPQLRGVGWPLGVEVRRQDLEAVATRVRGVRYVTGLRLGAITADGALLTNIERVPIVGLQLPRLVDAFVREGAPDELADLLGQAPPSAPPTQVPVPVLPKKC